MPQPYRYMSGERPKVSPAAPIERPALGLGIALVASHWAKVEQSLGLAFTALLSGQEPSAFESYHALFDMSIRHKMFMASARRKKVTQEILEEAESVHKEARRIANARNTVVHGTWATLSTKPNSLLLVDPTEIDRLVDQFMSELHDKIDDDTRDPSMRVWQFGFLIDEYVEYTQPDLQDIINRCIAVDGRAYALWDKVGQFAIANELERRERRKRR